MSSKRIVVTAEGIQLAHQIDGVPEEHAIQIFAAFCEGYEQMHRQEEQVAHELHVITQGNLRKTDCPAKDIRVTILRIRTQQYYHAFRRELAMKRPRQRLSELCLC